MGNAKNCETTIRQQEEINMGLVFEKNEKYDSVSFKLKDLGTNDAVKLELLYDEPMTGTSSFGAWFLVNCKLIEPETQPKASFFTTEKVAKQLEPFGAGDVVTITKRQKKNARGTYTVYEVEGAGNTKPSNSSPSNSNQQLVDMIVKNSEGEMKQPNWVRQQLREAGIEDDNIINELVAEYVSRW